jgi:hypothetical protein
LEVYSRIHKHAPVYSTSNSVGLLIGTGNLGQRLTDTDEPKNLYISRDGGRRWQSSKPGSYIYEVGDHGAIIVLAKNNEPTDEILFSLDEGASWHTRKFTSSPIIVQDILIEPSTIS